MTNINAMIFIASKCPAAAVLTLGRCLSGRTARTASVVIVLTDWGRLSRVARGTPVSIVWMVPKGAKMKTTRLFTGLLLRWVRK